MRFEAFFADTTASYVRPMEPDPGDEVRLFFQTPAEDGIEAFLIVTGGVPGTDGSACEMPMQATSADGCFAVHEACLNAGDAPLTYHFKAVCGGEVCRYGRLGICENEEEVEDFRVFPGFHTPDWAKGAVGYQILVDRFRNGDLDNDVVDGEYIYLGKPCRAQHNWDHLPKDGDYRDFYGGDLLGVMNKLDYLQELGVEVVYFNPLFVSPSSHKYDTQDYDHIDPHIGTIVEDLEETGLDASGEDRNPKGMKASGRYIRRTTSTANLEAGDALFAQLVGEMHARGMRVIIDGVFNHCGSFNRWMDRAGIYGTDGGSDGEGAYLSADSRYRDYFIFEETDAAAWPRNDSYLGWWDNPTLPKLNYASQALRDEILRIAAKWVSPPYCVDGWRLDVAADLGTDAAMNHAFWRDFRTVVKQANPEALIIAEHYGSPEEYLRGGEWDSVMNYDAFMEPAGWFFTGMEKHSDGERPELFGNGPELVKSLTERDLAFSAPSRAVAMNELSNHDHARFLTRTNRRVGRLNTSGPAAASDGVSLPVMREAVLFQMTWTGMPTVYYADEAGQAGWTDPDNRRVYPWGHENRGLIAFHREMIRIRRSERALREGSVRFLGAGDGWFAFARFTDGQRLIAAFNVSNEPANVTLPAWMSGASDEASWTCLAETSREGFAFDAGERAQAGERAGACGDVRTDEEEKIRSQAGELTVQIPACGAVLYKAE